MHASVKTEFSLANPAIRCSADCRGQDVEDSAGCASDGEPSSFLFFWSVPLRLR